MAQPIYAQGKVVGQVANGVFVKSIVGSKHILRKPRAIAFDVRSLRDAQDYGATRVAVQDIENGTVYAASIKEIMEHGFTLDRGFGKQVALPINKFQISVKDAKGVPQPTEPETVQLAAF